MHKIQNTQLMIIIIIINLLWVYFLLLLQDGSNQFLDTGRGFWTHNRGKREVVWRSRRDGCRGEPFQLFCDGYDLAKACH